MLFYYYCCWLNSSPPESAANISVCLGLFKQFENIIYTINETKVGGRRAAGSLTPLSTTTTTATLTTTTSLATALTSNYKTTITIVQLQLATTLIFANFRFWAFYAHFYDIGFFCQFLAVAAALIIQCEFNEIEVIIFVCTALIYINILTINDKF